MIDKLLKLQWALLRREHLTFAWVDSGGGSPRTHFLNLGDAFFNDIVHDKGTFKPRKFYSMKINDDYLGGYLPDVKTFGHLSLDEVMVHSFMKENSSFNKFLTGDELELHKLHTATYLAFVGANKEPTPKHIPYTENDARELYLCVRKNNHDISDEALDGMYSVLKDNLKGKL